MRTDFVGRQALVILFALAGFTASAARADDKDDKEYEAEFTSAHKAAKTRIESWAKGRVFREHHIDLGEKDYVNDFKWLAALSKSEAVKKSVGEGVKNLDLKPAKGTLREMLIRETLVGIWVMWRVERVKGLEVTEEKDFILGVEKHLSGLAQVVIKSNPEDASIEIDNLDQGTTQTVVLLRARKDNYTVRLQKDGYEEYKNEKVAPTPGKRFVVDATLKKK